MTQYILVYLAILLGSSACALAESRVKSPASLESMSFEIASQTGSYKISQFVGSNACWRFTNSNNTSINANGSIVCHVLNTGLGEFSLTVTDANNNTCVFSTQKIKPYVMSQSCSIPGVGVTSADPSYKTFQFGEWQINLP